MGSMSTSDAAPLPRLGEVFFDVRSASRSLRVSWYSDTGVAVLSIWQGGTCTGSFRLPMTDLPRMIEALQRGPGSPAAPGPAAPGRGGVPAGGHAAGPDSSGGPGSLHYLTDRAAAQGGDDSPGGHQDGAVAGGPGGEFLPPYPDEPGTVFYPGQPLYQDQPGQPPYQEQPGQPPYQEQPGQPPYQEQPGQQAHQDGPERYPGQHAAGYPGRPDAPRYSAPPGGAAYPDQPAAGYPVQPGEPHYPGQPGQSSYSPLPRHAPYAGLPGPEHYPAGPTGPDGIGHLDSRPESADSPYSNGSRSQPYSAGQPGAEYPRPASPAYGNDRPGWPGEPEPGWDNASASSATDALEPLPESFPYHHRVPDRGHR